MIYNLGSINADHFYDVPHIPAPGETLAATDFRQGLGGKGANQSIAAARAGARVKHIGAIGTDGAWMRDQLAASGVDVSGIKVAEDPSGHAIITRACDGENAITLYPGANQNIADAWVEKHLTDIGPDDWLMLQNETNEGLNAAKFARANGARVCYSAAPFETGAVAEILPQIDMLVMNAGEHAQMMATLGPQPQITQLITMGGDDARLCLPDGTEIQQAAPKVDVLDTTGAGDTFIGVFIATLSAGATDADALSRATHAAALKVTKKGTADAIPTAEEISAFVSLF